MLSLIRPALQVAAPVIGRAAISAGQYVSFACAFTAVSTSGYLIGRFVTEQVTNGADATSTWLANKASNGRRQRIERFKRDVELEIARRVNAGELSMRQPQEPTTGAVPDFVDAVAQPA